ncbi:MAG: hypothetical protein JJE25_09335 [Bacteroidia bacterium]|nr:hypothetical protein [Bacteroidia bacterium]
MKTTTKSHGLKTKYAFVVLMIAISTGAFGQTGKSLAVLNIESKGVIADAEGVGNMVRLEMEKTGMYKMFDRFDVADVMKKNNLDISNCFAKSCLLETGKLLKADKVMTGSVERFGEKIAITLKIVDVQTGDIEKANTTEYLNLQKEIHKMIGISVKKLVGIEPEKYLMDVLIAYNQPIESSLTTVNLSGPRAGVYYTDGLIGERMRADKTNHGGLGMYNITSVIGWQQEVQYLSAGNFQGLVECIFTGSGLESGRFIPAFTFLNGFRLNRQGWEIAFGPTFRFVRKANGYYTGTMDDNGEFKYDPIKDWHLENEWTASVKNPYPIVSNVDDRGEATLSAGLVVAAGKTFKSGYLNIPVNVYIIPNKKGNVYGLSLGFNIIKSKSETK